jgi:Protein of unknown function (DUF3829)
MSARLLWILLAFVTFEVGVPFVAELKSHLMPVQIPSQFEQAAASRRTLIGCLNEHDGPLREHYERYQARYRELFNGHETSTLMERFQGLRAIDRPYAPIAERMLAPVFRCSAGIVNQVKAFDPDGELARTINDYQQTFVLLEPISDAVDRFYVTPKQTDLKKAQQLNAQLVPVAEKLFQLSDALRQQIETQEMQLRGQQLDAIAARYGHDQHWHTLNIMMQARETVSRLSQAASDTHLTPVLLAEERENMQRALQQADAYLQAHPRLSDAEGRRSLLEILGPAGRGYQLALNQLHADWQENAEPAQLSHDFYAVTHGYDELLTVYNDKVGGKY